MDSNIYTTYLASVSKKNMKKSQLQLRSLRLSLKYRPEIFRLIQNLKLCIKKKNFLLRTLQKQLGLLEKKVSDLDTNNDKIKLNIKDVSTQTEKFVDNNKDEVVKAIDVAPKPPGAWNLDSKDGKEEKSIAEQVKEVAQSALQETGMVYVESAGMYYDYKTGYYYNSELGLYYHTDTNCYYYYSNEKQTFVFHSYPDRSMKNANASLEAHEKRKARKSKRERKADEIEALTKNLAQGKEEGSSEASQPKRKKESQRKKKKKTERNETDNLMKDDERKSDNDKDKSVKPTAEVGSGKDEEVPKENQENGGIDDELEDGECSETASEQSDEESESYDSTSTATDEESVARHHPPCMRVIVRESNLPKLKVGSLFLITKDGGTVGREGDGHAILIRDHNVSRNHMEIKYDERSRKYFMTDLGSKNGSILNGNRMSESQVVSEPLEVVHGSMLQLGEVKLLCHIHPGNDTCGHCEPGLLLENLEKEKVAYTRTCSVQKQHQLELARLKNKYAPKLPAIEPTAYNDRASARRRDVGSSHHSEKTQANDVDTFIAPENKGFKLLEKMGWAKGEGLGKDKQGDVEPIPLVGNEGKVGLGGAGSAVAPSSAPKPKNKLGSATLRLASKTKMLQPPAKAFQVEDDDEDLE